MFKIDIYQAISGHLSHKNKNNVISTEFIQACCKSIRTKSSAEPEALLDNESLMKSFSLTSLITTRFPLDQFLIQNLL